MGKPLRSAIPIRSGHNTSRAPRLGRGRRDAGAAQNRKSGTSTSLSDLQREVLSAATVRAHRSRHRAGVD